MQGMDDFGLTWTDGGRVRPRGYAAQEDYLENVMAITDLDGNMVALDTPPEATEEQMMEAVERFMAGEELPEGFSVRPPNTA
jgi:hypothetical protein